jgi:MFS family permease
VSGAVPPAAERERLRGTRLPVSAGRGWLEALVTESAMSAGLDRVLRSEVESADRARRAGHRALWAAFLGFGVDMFDVYLPVLALGPAMAYFQPATLSPALRSTAFYAVFALSLVGRPVGAAVFGHYGDKIGRRRVTIISMTGFATVTLAIGALPGYETWGLGSLVVLTLLRFVDGVLLGGEYVGANPLAMEYAPKERRGIWAAIIHTGFPVSMTVMSLLTAALLRVLPAGSPRSPYAIWGWRIPFVLGAFLAGAVALYYLRRVPESTVWAKAAKPASPLAELLRGENRCVLAQVFLVMSGAWFTLNAVTSILPGILLTIRHVDSLTVTNAQLAAYIVLVFGFMSAGVLGQWIGRRAVLVLFGVLGSTVGPILYYVLVNSGYHSVVELVLLVSLVNLCALPVWAVTTAYLSERFNTGVRASGYGLGYSAAMIIPAFSSFYMLGLQAIGMSYAYTELAIFALGGILLTVGALAGPETNHVEMG